MNKSQTFTNKKFNFYMVSPKVSLNKKSSTIDYTVDASEIPFPTTVCMYKTLVYLQNIYQPQLMACPPDVPNRIGNHTKLGQET